MEATKKQGQAVVEKKVEVLREAIDLKVTTREGSRLLKRTTRSARSLMQHG